eukprot:NODE_2945_length_1309_cov_141.570826_g2796_i0.p1 GENE.NODE_2945_length_1309_cov_141.570826_g2796_i0~~NODE_2945_length_1309_cov_141.570826_g2796_i0.p1  ORF type:complete len:359 (-),score=51.28 NODE_2945_length_1309_cov_141.570826_g2796_i0:147-1223(-)
MGPPKSKGPWVIKESKQYKGNKYRFNTETGESQWITDDKPPAAPTPSAWDRSGATQASSKGKGKHPIVRSMRASVISWGTDDTDAGSECVCTICECGRHGCPVHRYTPTAFNGNSRYREDYPVHKLRPRDKREQKGEPHHTPADANHFMTKYEQDYPSFIPDPARSMKPAHDMLPNCPFVGTTTNSEMFTPLPTNSSPPKRRRCVSATPNNAKFEGRTTNQEQFRAYPKLRPRKAMAPPNPTIVAAPFDGLSKYKEDYPGHQPEPGRGKKVPSIDMYSYGPPRKLETEQRAAFDKKPLPLCPALQLSAKEPSIHTGHIHYTKTKSPVRYYPGSGIQDSGMAQTQTSLGSAYEELSRYL